MGKNKGKGGNPQPPQQQAAPKQEQQAKPAAAQQPAAQPKQEQKPAAAQQQPQGKGQQQQQKGGKQSAAVPITTQQPSGQPTAAGASPTFKFDFGAPAKGTESTSPGQFKFDFGGKQQAAGGTTLGGPANSAPQMPNLPTQGQQQQGGKRKGVPQKMSSKRQQQLEEEDEEDEDEEEEPQQGARGGPRSADERRLLMQALQSGQFNLMESLQERMQDIIGQSSGYVDSLPKEVKRRINALKNLQKQRQVIEKQMRNEIAEIERKYEAKYQPIYQKRASIVTGQYEPKDNEVELSGEEEEENRIEEINENEEKSEEPPAKGIPEFWLGAMEGNNIFMNLIEEEDRAALAHITDIRCKQTNDKDTHSFTLEFHFSDNEFFTDKVLTKTVYFAEEDPEMGDIELDHMDGCEIHWKPGKNLTIEKIKKTVKPKGGARRGGPKGSARRGSFKEKPEEIWVERAKPSFFNFFSTDHAAELEAVMSSGQGEQDEEEAIQQFNEQDYDIALELREKVIPHAVSYFLGEIQDDDFQDEDEEGMDDEDEDEDEFEDEDEEDLQPVRGGRGGAPKRGGFGGPVKQIGGGKGGKGGFQQFGDDDDEDDDEEDGDFQPPPNQECKQQ